MIKYLSRTFLILAFSLACLSGCQSIPEKSIGSHARLHAPNSKPLPLAINEQSLSEALKAAKAKDEYATQEMLTDGRIFTVGDNTEVLIIGDSAGAVNVRVLNGPYTGKTGWVITEWVK